MKIAIGADHAAHAVFHAQASVVAEWNLFDGRQTRSRIREAAGRCRARSLLSKCAT